MTLRTLGKAIAGVLLLGLWASFAHAQENDTLQEALDAVRRQIVELRTEFQAKEQDRNALVGRVEQIEFQLSRIIERLDGLVFSLDSRLAEIEQNLAELTPAEQTNLAMNEFSNPTAQKSEGLDQTLGKIKVDAEGNPIGGGSINTQKTTADRYAEAINLIKEKEYDQARLALQRLLKEAPDDPLASNIQYWIGETYYVQDQYERAVSQFARSALKYPEGAKVLDSLLKLSLSLGQLDRTEDACRTLKQMRDNSAKVGQELALARDNAWQNYGCGATS